VSTSSARPANLIGYSGSMYTQLGDVEPSTAKQYIGELANKYSPGKTIASSPSVIRQEEKTGVKITGQPLRGDLVLEVPSQAKAVPKEILDYAKDRAITIRTTDGVVLTP
jgi:hypothetical protein